MAVVTHCHLSRSQPNSLSYKTSATWHNVRLRYSATLWSSTCQSVDSCTMDLLHVVCRLGAWRWARGHTEGPCTRTTKRRGSVAVNAINRIDYYSVQRQFTQSTAKCSVHSSALGMRTELATSASAAMMLFSRLLHQRLSGSALQPSPHSHGSYCISTLVRRMTRITLQCFVLLEYDNRTPWIGKLLS